MNVPPRPVRRLVELGVLTAVLLALAPMVGRAAAATIAEPRGNPYHVELDARGQPVPFTIAVAGFPAGSLVYVEQCDARPTSAPNWAPTRDCDIGTSPAAVIVDAGGRARFEADDRNHSFQPFVGLGPESLFSCLTPDASASKNGLPDYRSCQVRVSSSNSQSTIDQVFLPIVFVNVSARPGGAARPGSPSSNTTTAVVVVSVAAVVVAGAGLAFGLRRRRANRTA